MHFYCAGGDPVPILPLPIVPLPVTTSARYGPPDTEIPVDMLPGASTAESIGVSQDELRSALRGEVISGKRIHWTANNMLRPGPDPVIRSDEQLLQMIPGCLAEDGDSKGWVGEEEIMQAVAARVCDEHTAMCWEQGDVVIHRFRDDLKRLVALWRQSEVPTYLRT